MFHFAGAAVLKRKPVGITKSLVTMHRGFDTIIVGYTKIARLRTETFDKAVSVVYPTCENCFRNLFR